MLREHIIHEEAERPRAGGHFGQTEPEGTTGGIHPDHGLRDDDAFGLRELLDEIEPTQGTTALRREIGVPPGTAIEEERVACVRWVW